MNVSHLFSGVHHRCFLSAKLEGREVEIPWTNEYFAPEQPYGE